MIFEAAHWSGLLPLAAVVVARAGGRRVPPEYLWLAAAFGVSVFADTLQSMTGGGFGVTHLYVPVQLALAFAAVEREGLNRLVAVAGLGFLAALSWRISPDMDWLVTTGGSGLVLVAAWRHQRVRLPIVLYFGLGSAAYLWMLPAVGTMEILPRWLAYQGCRWLAFAAFAWALFDRRVR